MNGPGTPGSAPADPPARGEGAVPRPANPWRAFLGAVLLNALLAFPLLYQSYKHYDAGLTPWDVGAYMEMVERPGDFEPPFRYRVLAPALVKAMRILPGYDIPVDFTDDPAVKRDYFHFSLLNFCITVLVSGLIFLYLGRSLEPAFAYLGSVLYLLSFYTVVTNLIPMGDTACHLAIMGCILLFEGGKPLAFALACLIGVFTKETLLIVLVPWILLGSLRHRARLRYLLWASPAALAYAAAARLFPAATEFNYYRPGFMLRRVAGAFLPSTWDASLVFHVFAAQAPLLPALAAYAWMKRFRGPRGLAVNKELILYPFLIWLGITMDIGNSTGRVAFMAFPAIIGFEAMVAQAWVTGRAPAGRSLPRA